MAKHKLFIDLAVQDLKVGSKDVVFKIYEGDEEDKKFGELRLSKGAVVWRRRGQKIGRKLPWPKFDELMQESAYHAERRPPKSRVTVRKKKRRS